MWKCLLILNLVVLDTGWLEEMLERIYPIKDGKHS